MGGESLGAKAPAAAQLQKPLVVVAADLAAFDQVADEGHLIMREADALGYLGIGQAKGRALALDGGEILQPDRIAAAPLVVVAQPEYGLAEALDHGLGDADLGSRKPPAHEPSGAFPRFRPARRIGSAKGAPTAIGHTRMHSKH